MNAVLPILFPEIEPMPVPKTFRLHSAEVRVRWVTRSVAEIRYQGALLRPAFEALRRVALEATKSAQAVVIRMDTALVLSAVMPALPGAMYTGCTAPGCLVVPLEQFALWRDHTRALAALGVMRIVFVPSQQRQAYEMADSLAAMPGRSAAGRLG